MMSDQERLFVYIKDSIYTLEPMPLDIESFPKKCHQVVAGIQKLCEWTIEARKFLSKLASGDFEAKPPEFDNEVAAELKTLQSEFLHLTWQIEQVTKGDYSQQVDFMGALSDSFNRMIEQLRERTKALGYLDALTNCHNRRYCMESLQKLYRENAFFLVAFVDIDYLKYCNDKFGHKAGDRYIQHVAEALERLPEKKTVCRMDGDEFIVIFENISESVAWQELTDARNEIMERSIADQGEISESFSFGLASTEHKDVCTVTDLLDLADREMYTYKVKSKKISRKVYQGQVADMERFYRNLPLGVLHVQMDMREGISNFEKAIVVSFNNHLADMFGYTTQQMDDLYLKTPFAAIYEQDLEAYQNAIRQSIKDKTEQDFTYKNLRFQRQDGSIGVMQVNVALADISDFADAYFIYTEINLPNDSHWGNG